MLWALPAAGALCTDRWTCPLCVCVSRAPSLQEKGRVEVMSWRALVGCRDVVESWALDASARCSAACCSSIRSTERDRERGSQRGEREEERGGERRQGKSREGRPPDVGVRALGERAAGHWLAGRAGTAAFGVRRRRGVRGRERWSSGWGGRSRAARRFRLRRGRSDGGVGETRRRRCRPVLAAARWPGAQGGGGQQPSSFGRGEHGGAWPRTKLARQRPRRSLPCLRARLLRLRQRLRQRRPLYCVLELGFRCVEAGAPCPSAGLIGVGSELWVAVECSSTATPGGYL
jgi:hypothetical protein